MGFSIHLAKREELPKISELERACFKDEAYSLQYLEFLQFHYPDTFLVAKIDEEIVGYAVLMIERELGHLASIAVHPKNRRRGIGSALLSELIKISKRKGISIIRLEVRESNLAVQRLYKKFGFKPIGKLVNYYSDGEAAIVMVKNLKE